MTRSISVTEGAGAAFGFLARSWRRAAGALVLAGLLSGAVGAAFLNRDFGRARLLFMAYLLAAIMAEGALFRIARDDVGAASPSWGGFQWGAIEWRILAVVILRALLFSLLGGLFLTVLAVVYVGMAAAEARQGFAAAAGAGWRPTLDTLGWTVVSVAGMAGMAGLIWVSLRLYLAFAATVARGRVQLLSAWTLTRGRVWRMLGAILLILALPLGFALLAQIARGLLGGDSGWVGVVVSLIAGVCHAILILPLSVGLMSYLYDRLGRDDAGAA